jgi:hypothetical protein
MGWNRRTLQLEVMKRHDNSTNKDLGSSIYLTDESVREQINTKTRHRKSSANQTKRLRENLHENPKPSHSSSSSVPSTTL